MKQEDFNELNTFNLGRWLFLPSFSSKPEGFNDRCLLLCKLFQNTDVCLKDMAHTEEYLTDSDFFVFIDNQNKAQIVGNTYYGYMLQCLRGVCDKYEQNIDIKYIDVANEFLNNNLDLKNAKLWKNQINWIARLYSYNYLLSHKQYSKIDVNKLIDDLAYNGFSLHNNAKSSNDIYYPFIKRMLFTQPMLKPLIAKHLGCKPSEVFVGKYSSNGKNVKYIVGDLISSYLSEDCSIEKVFGSIKIKNYKGPYKYVFNIETTLNCDIKSPNGVEMDWFGWLQDTELISNK